MESHIEVYGLLISIINFFNRLVVIYAIHILEGRFGIYSEMTNISTRIKME